MMAPLIAQNGKISAGIECVAKQKSHWIAVPACVRSPTLPPCARIDLFKRIAWAASEVEGFSRS
jgi:hypothetical protein